MRKKMIASVLLMSLSLSLLTGCGGNTVPESTGEEASVEDVTEEDTEEVTEEDTEEVSEEESTGAKEASDGNSAPDNVVEATLENPAKIGEWVATIAYSPTDQEDHTIYYRITGVIRGEEAQKIIDEYHAGDNFYEFSDLEDDDLEYCVLTYETYFPPEFPEEEYEGMNLGITTNVNLSFSLCNLEDFGTIGNYLGLDSRDISEDPEEFYAGNTFAEGRAVMVMIKDFDEYLIYPDYDYEHKTYTRGE